MLENLQLKTEEEPEKKSGADLSVEVEDGMAHKPVLLHSIFHAFMHFQTPRIGENSHNFWWLLTPFPASLRKTLKQLHPIDLRREKWLL